MSNKITLSKLSAQLRNQVESVVLDRASFEQLLKNYVIMALDIADQAIKERDEISIKYTGMEFDRYKKG